MSICSFILSTIKHPQRKLFRLYSTLWNIVIQIFTLIVDTVPIAANARHHIDKTNDAMSRYALTLLLLLPWLSPMCAETETDTQSTHKPVSPKTASVSFAAHTVHKKNKSKHKDGKHSSINLNMALRCFFSPGTLVGISSLILTRIVLLCCEYYYDFTLIYPSFHAYFLGCIISKIFEIYWYSASVFGREWERLSFPKKFYMNGIPAEYINDPSPHLISFGFNILMTLVIAQMLVFCNYLHSTVNPILFGVLLGLLIVALNGRDHAFCRRPLKLFYINQAHSMLQCIFISTILTYV